jgi:hypothetical protein
MKRNRTVAIVAFVGVLLFWFATVTHDTLGFVAPLNAEAVGFDLWTAMVWLAFLYTIWNLWRAFTTPSKAPSSGNEK